MVSQHADVNVNKILIGNKCDMSDQRVISYEEGEALAKEYNIRFFETSAKQDISVEKSFITIATEVKDRIIADGGGVAPQSKGHQISPATPSPKQAGGGCCK
jgi:Ras-related protein Rab-8A